MGVSNENSLMRFSNLGIEIEERVNAHAQLPFDLFARAFQNVHRHVGLVSVGEFEGCILHLGDFTLRQEAQTVDQSQISHEPHLISRTARLAVHPCGERSDTISKSAPMLKEDALGKIQW